MKNPTKQVTRLLIWCLMVYAIPMHASNNLENAKSVKDVFVDLSLVNATVKDAFSQLEEKTSFKFHYSKSNIKIDENFYKEYKQVSVAQILTDIGKEAQLKFKQVNNTISVNKAKSSKEIVNSIEIDILLNAVSITITDENNEPLPGVNVIVKGTNTGGITDTSGNMTIDVEENTTLVISYIGYKTQEVNVGTRSSVSIKMVADTEQLQELIIVGSRNAPRSSTDTPLPVDMISSDALISTGQPTFDKALQYLVPSFNTVQTPVNDATAILDPYEIRNMGPSRTLVLINGKRKNLSALLYTQTSPGRGETGADISAIPTDAIKRVEILRDGASAQYGSDAIAGVMNIVLKDDADDGSVTLRTGMSSEGDGEMLGISLNNGSSLGDGKGFINYTVDLSKVGQANRPGTVDGGTSTLGSNVYGPANRPLAGGEYADFVFTDPDKADNYLVNGLLGGIDISGFDDNQKNSALATYSGTPAFTTRNNEINQGNDNGISDVDNFLALMPDAGNINGSPETTSAKFLVNGGMELNENTSVYANAAYVYKKVNSYANYRTPYWRTEADFPYLADFFPNGSNGEYVGYVPTFDGDLNDYNATLGFKSKKNDWNYDASLTIGGNRQTYTIRDSHNRNTVYSPSVWVDANTNGTVDDGEMTEGSQLYRENSQVSFDPGGTQFNHTVGNIDISRVVSDQLGIAFGSEFRSETFTVIEGELSSYDGGGADSFAGNAPENSGKFNRYNFGAYIDIAFDATEDFLIAGTARIEDYSDFGSAFVWKLSSRYKLAEEKATLRGSLSTGFRAPTLHQIYTQKAQYSFIPGQGIQVGGLVNNVSREANLLNIDNLDAESSTNFTFGMGSQVNDNFNFTVDYYSIKVKDRIILSNEIVPPSGPAFQGLSDISFFTNALDTKTSGVDVVMNYKNVAMGSGKLGFNLSGNYTIANERDGAVKNPDFVTNSGQSVVDATQEALFFTSRPKTKWILGVNYNINKWNLALNNTYFGKTTFQQQGMDASIRTEFTPKIVTDLSINYEASEKVNVTLNLNNLLNILPEWEFVANNANGETLLADPAQVKEQSNLITFNQRYSQMTYDGYQFSQLGTLVNLSVNVRF
jgi:iron complex outermembrane receptor protein